MPANENAKLSGRTVKHYHELLSSIFRTAVEWNVITNNPVSRVRAPRTAKKAPQYYEEPQVIELLQLLEKAPLKYKTMIYMAIDTGLREGELTGLKWEDIKFEERHININKQRQYIHGYGVITKEPKTESGNRVITISEMLSGLLKALKSEQKLAQFSMGSKWIDSGYVFVGDNGEPMHPHRPYKWFVNFLEKNNLPKITFHALRHTNASLLLAEGTDIVTLSGRLGHADKNVTLNVYSHLLKSKEKQASSKMDEFYSKNKIITPF